MLRKLYTRKPLNGKTPQWFQDFYNREFLPMKIRNDLILTLAVAILCGIILIFIKG